MSIDPNTIAIVSIAVASVSLVLALLTLKQLGKTNESVKTVNGQLNETQEQIGKTNESIERAQALIQNVSALVSDAQDIGVVRIHRTRTVALNDFWESHVRNEPGEIKIAGTSMLGLTTNVVDYRNTVRDNPSRFNFVMVDPEFADTIEGEGIRPEKRRGDIENTLRELTGSGVQEENIRLHRGQSMRFAIFTPTRALINPALYGDITSLNICIECEKRETGDLYHRYLQQFWRAVWCHPRTHQYEPD